MDDYDLYLQHKLKSVSDLIISKNGECIIAGCSNGFLHALNSSGNTLWKNQLKGLTSISISDDGNYVAADSKSEKMHLFKINGNLIWEKNITKVNAIGFSKDSNYVVVGTESGTISCFDLNGDQIWKKKVKGFSQGGISHSATDDCIVVGSWNLVYYFSVTGDILWKYKAEKRIKNIDVSDNLIAICTRGGVEVINENGELIFKSDRDCDHIRIGKDNSLYIVNNRGIYPIDCNGNNLNKFDAPADIIDIDISKGTGDIALNSKNHIYVYSASMVPKIEILTEYLILGESQKIHFEIENICNRKISSNVILNSSNFQSKGNNIIPIELDPLEKRQEFFTVIPIKSGKNLVDIGIIDKNANCIKEVNVDADKLNIDASLSPKYEFNSEGDETTLVISLENKTEMVIKNVSIKENSDLFLKELLPNSSHSFEFKLDLRAGTHNVSRTIVCFDEFENDHNFTCKNDNIIIHDAPYEWSLSESNKLINGECTELNLLIRNVVNRQIDLNIELESEFIDLDSTVFVESIASNENKNIKLSATPNVSGEKCIKLTISEGKNTKDVSKVLNIEPKPPSIKVESSIGKSEYEIGELVTQEIVLKNIGESAALNVELMNGLGERIKKIPSLQPDEAFTTSCTYEFMEVKHIRLSNVIAKYEVDNEVVEAKCEKILEFDVKENEINVVIPEIILKENISAKSEIIIENRSDVNFDNVECEMLINDQNIEIGDVMRRIKTLESKSRCALTYALLSSTEGEYAFKITVRYNNRTKQINSKGIIITEAKPPKLELIIDDSNLIQDEFSLLKINLENNTQVAISDISIKFDMPIKILGESVIDYNTISELVKIEPGQKIPLRLNLMPEKTGKIVANIVLNFNNNRKKPYNQVEHREIEIHENIKNEKHDAPNNIYNIGEIVGGSKFNDSIVSESKIEGTPTPSSHLIPEDMNEPVALKSYRNLCVNAYDDKVITQEEMDMLDGMAQVHNISENDRHRIESEIFGESLDKERNHVKYMDLFRIAFKDENISDDERAMLDTNRVDLNLSRDEQQEIEYKVRKEY